jgi:hypothetical protein
MLLEMAMLRWGKKLWMHPTNTPGSGWGLKEWVVDATADIFISFLLKRRELYSKKKNHNTIKYD